MTDDPSLSNKGGTLPDLETVYNLLAARAAGKETDQTVEAAVARLVPSINSSTTTPKRQEPEPQQEPEPLRFPVGTLFTKNFPGYGTFQGRVESFDGEYYHVVYPEDGDSEDLTVDELAALVRNEKQEGKLKSAKNDESGDDEEDDDDDEEEEDDDDDDGKVAIEEDTENYDDDDDEGVSSKHDESSGKRKISDKEKLKEENASPTKRKRGRPRKYKPKLDWSMFQDIPYGRQGAQMLATFGDARTPKVETVQAVLEGAAILIKAAIHDARQVRREFVQNFQNAKRSLRADRQQKPENKGEWSSELMYRVMVKNARTNTPSEGCFTIEELKTLYPEEMNVYDRWLLMREKADKDKDEVTTKTEEGEDEDPEEDELEKVPVPERYVERTSQFDQRTDRMEKDFYIEFAEVRQGSFLGRITSAEANEKGNEVGRWAKMLPIHRRFLVWCGFDPQSSEPPPNDATTEALGFLAYNFLGRIVESAIRLRNSARKQEVGVVEVAIGDQLEVSDIENAMNQPDVKQASVFSNPDQGAQLYFGPGFESRLELELDAMVQAATKKSTLKASGSLAADDMLAHFVAPKITASPKEKEPDEEEK